MIPHRFNFWRYCVRRGGVGGGGSAKSKIKFLLKRDSKIKIWTLEFWNLKLKLWCVRHFLDKKMSCYRVVPSTQNVFTHKTALLMRVFGLIEALEIKTANIVKSIQILQLYETPECNYGSSNQRSHMSLPPIRSLVQHNSDRRNNRGNSRTRSMN